MSCKCGARTYEGHLKKGHGHVYTGPYWRSK